MNESLRRGSGDRRTECGLQPRRMDQRRSGDGQQTDGEQKRSRRRRLESQRGVRTFGASRADKSAAAGAGQRRADRADHQRRDVPGMAVSIAARRTAASLLAGGGAGNVERNRYELGKEGRKSLAACGRAAATNLQRLVVERNARLRFNGDLETRQKEEKESTRGDGGRAARHRAVRAVARISD